MRSHASGRVPRRLNRHGPPQVFIAYRWDDTRHVVDGLYDGLAKRMPDAHIFMDDGSIRNGERVQERIMREIERCDTMLVLIGDSWLDVAGADGIRRLDAPDDFVRTEIAAALRGGLRVIPVLVHGAQRPVRAQLPPEISELAELRAPELRKDNWRADLDALAADLANPPQRSRAAVTSARRGRARPARLVAIATIAAVLFGAALALSSAISPDATRAARPAAPLKLVKAPAVALTVPAFTGSPADLRQPRKAQLSGSSNAPAGGSTNGTGGGSGATGGNPAPVPVGPLEGSS